ncbi:hypothetical protein CA850_29850 [Micromonospora echinospora]|uniref:Uncharacterized protein n=1 Tax=Micromonospora echinospora TaxID=1877 RepID=A0A1C5AAJ9_MICEC|nr:hypothetical protein [Micromonospora echinospora]OZV74783.1 hypothetical protein CA850_29850 [Micromonospora echinospora]SCF42237.1 hypothetical protein GA0070618_6631 [Micromonospora echinospora]
MTLTPTSALAEAREFVLSLPGAGELDAAALAQQINGIATLLLEYAERPAPDDEIDTDAEPGPLGALSSVPCTVVPSDSAWVDAYQTVRGKRVRLGLVDGSTRPNIVVTPSDARRYAAGILNAADEADGTSRLLFGIGSPQS